MKPFLSLILIAGVLFQILGQQLTYWEFEANKDFIINNICEQRYNSTNKCQGACHLKKALESHAPDSESQEGSSQKSVYGFNWFYQEISLLIGVDQSQSSKISMKDAFYDLQDYKFEIFHPPVAG